MGYLMTEHDGQRSLVPGHWQQAFVDHNLSAGHAERIDALVLDKVELPAELLDLVAETVVVQIGGHGVGQSLPYPLHHFGVLRVGRLLGRSHVLGILLTAQREHLLVAHQQRLLTPRDGHGARGSTAGKHDSCHQR